MLFSLRWRAEQMATVLSPPRDIAGADRAEFWRLRGQQDGRKNDLLRRSQVEQSTLNTPYPTYEKVVLREGRWMMTTYQTVVLQSVSEEVEICAITLQMKRGYLNDFWIVFQWILLFLCVSSAGFRRPVVIFGPIADAATERLAKEMPDQFVIASMFLLLCACQHELHYQE